MKVFLSWSGVLSQTLAEILHQWLPEVIQACNPYFSPEDNIKGGRWHDKIAKELATSQVGLICVTAESLKSQWILFEAGALSKNLDKARICPILFNVSVKELKNSPLDEFQAAKFEKKEIEKVVKMINRTLGRRALSDRLLTLSFNTHWPELKRKVEAELARHPTKVANSLFISAPMNAYKLGDKAKNYQKTRADILKLAKVFEEYCGITDIYCACKDIENFSDFEETDTSLSIVYDEIVKREFFVLVYPGRDAAGSVLVEAGIALASGSKSLYLCKSEHDLPFLLQKAPNAAMNVKTYTYHSKADLLSKFYRNHKNMFNFDKTPRRN